VELVAEFLLSHGSKLRYGAVSTARNQNVQSLDVIERSETRYW
jgi:hypothetical protein